MMLSVITNYNLRSVIAMLGPYDDNSNFYRRAFYKHVPGVNMFELSNVCVLEE